MTLGQKIHKLRLERNLSQEDLADKMGVSRQSVSKWETDTSIPDLDKLLKLSDLFGVSLDGLVKEKMGKERGEKQEETGRKAQAATEKKKLSKQTLAGILLLVMGYLVFFVFFIFGRWEKGLLLGALLFMSGIICLFCRRNAGQ